MANLKLRLRVEKPTNTAGPRYTNSAEKAGSGKINPTPASKIKIFECSSSKN